MLAVVDKLGSTAILYTMELLIKKRKEIDYMLVLNI